MPQEAYDSRWCGGSSHVGMNTNRNVLEENRLAVLKNLSEGQLGAA
jgi:hypothetical protein